MIEQNNAIHICNNVEKLSQIYKYINLKTYRSIACFFIKHILIAVLVEKFNHRWRHLMTQYG